MENKEFCCRSIIRHDTTFERALLVYGHFQCDLGVPSQKEFYCTVDFVRSFIDICRKVWLRAELSFAEFPF